MAMAEAALKLAVVTGGNQGIGYEIARGLGKRGDFHVIMTSRSEEKGKQAAAALQAEGARVECVAADITDEASIVRLAQAIQTQHDGRLDVLVNNAGMAYKGDVFGAAEARATIDTNFYGTIRVTEALLPFLRRSQHGGRIINVCSQAGRLSQVSPELQAKFQDPAATKESISALMEQFISDIKDGKHRERGWSNSMYGISKLGEIAYTYTLSRQLLPEHIAANACCPGWCSTNMSSFRGPRSAEKGSETPVWLATRPGKPSDITGGFWYDMGLVSW